MSSRFEYRPLVLALLALHSAPTLAQEAAAATAPEATAPTTPVTPAPAAAPLAAPANTAQATELQTVTVQAQTGSAYKADTVSSPKATAPLLDTPQTITVIKKEILQEQGAVTLMEALRNTPGITMQMGENGNTSAGDTFQMRGFSTQSSTFVDGIRDLGAITRDTFNLEAVEVVKGPSGADIGRGATSGYINLVSKLPGLENATSGSLTVSTVDHRRLSADINQKVGETSAVRLNVMGQLGDVPGRNVVENNSWGVAPSFATGLGTDKRTYVYFQHVQQSNVPDGGVPTIGMEGYYNATPALDNGAKVNRENFYGSVNDSENVTADMLTLKIENDLDANTTLTNTTRYGQTKMDRVLTGVGNANVNGQPANPAAWTAARSRQAVDQENRILGNITNLATSVQTGFVKHTVATGIELMYEQQESLHFLSSQLVPVPAANLYNPDPNVTLTVPGRTGGSTNGSTLTTAAYLFDTMEFSPAFQVSAGLRFEHFKTDTNGKTLVSTASPNNAAQYPGYTAGQLAPDASGNSDNLLSWKVGALYKPASNASVYAAYATSLTPPGSANFTVANANVTGSSSNPNLDPQETENIELGTKWDVLSNRLSLTAALYRTSNFNELSNYDSVTNTYTQYGERQVQGIELGAVGNITEAWQISAGIATMDTEIKEGSTGNNAAGAATRWSPDLTGNVWTTYAVSSAFTVGGGARYVSEQKRVVDPTANVATSPMPEIPAYWVVDAMASYKLMEKLTVRGNIYNLLDEEYISVLNNGGNRMSLGAPLYASVSLDFQF